MEEKKYFTVLKCFQNYFRDPWNAFDFFIVAGSLVDLGLASLNVSLLGIQSLLQSFDETILPQSTR